MAKEQSFETFSGNDVKLRIAAEDADQDNVPLDLSGALALQFAIGVSARSRDMVVEKTLGDGVTITDAAQGEIEIVLDAEDLEPLRGSYYHELRLTDLNGKVSTLMYGQAIFRSNLIRVS